MYKKAFPQTIRSEHALLIVDEHTGRECPLGLLLLRKARGDILILSGHTTHVAQMFDVVIASALKSKYSKP